MKTQLLTILAASALALSSCANKENPEPERKALTFNGKIRNLQATTNSGTVNTTWATNDSIGLFMVANGTNTIIDDYSNRHYNYSNNQFVAGTGQEMFYPVSDDLVDFVAYYPYKSSYDINTTTQLDFSNQTNISKLDLLYAKASNLNKSAGTNVSLVFNHLLSKVVIKPVAGTGLSTSDAGWNSMNVQITGLNTKASFNVGSGVISSANTVTNVTPFTRTAGTSYEAIVVPETYSSAGAITFTFQIGSDTYVYKSPAGETFEKGKEYTYDITINKTGVVVGNVTINDWTAVSRTGVAN